MVTEARVVTGGPGQMVTGVQNLVCLRVVAGGLVQLTTGGLG